MNMEYASKMWLQSIHVHSNVVTTEMPVGWFWATGREWEE
jgi:hypothetical protein